MSFLALFRFRRAGRVPGAALAAAFLLGALLLGTLLTAAPPAHAQEGDPDDPSRADSVRAGDPPERRQGADAAELGEQKAAAPVGQQDPNQGDGESIPTIPNLAGPQQDRNFLAQQAEGGDGPVPTLTLAEAVRVALSENYQLQRMRLDVERAEAQIRQAWSQVLPSVTLSSSYTRNVIQANPFAGSNVGGLFDGGNATDWVAFNERARQDENPSTMPITFQEFQERQAQGRREAGIDPGPQGSPFTVDNQFQSDLSISQPLFNGQAFVAIQGAQALEEVNELAATRQEQTTVNQTRQAYYRALLAGERARVTAQNVERTRETYKEVAQQVAAGTAPKYERVSMRVELENLRAQLTERANAATNAIDRLKRTIGFPVDQPVRLRGALKTEDLGQFTQVSMQEAMARAIENRPDVQRARRAIELRQNDRRQAQAQYLPTVSAVANFSYTGRVPDDRTSTVMPDPTDPFTFGQRSQGFFADNLWNPSVSVGVQLSWNIFGGFRRAAVVEQRQVAVNQAQIDRDQLLAQVRVEVQQALRNLEAARERIRSRQANVERAELNYEMAQKRLGVRAATQLQLREASDQLDQARLNYLQAVYDYLDAKSAYETAIGTPADKESLLRFTSR
jgi:outer membrane protein TolC